MKKRTAVTILLNIFFILLVFVIILPAAWLIMNSLKTNVELFTDSLALPAKVQFANYISAWNKGLYKYFGNSVIVSSISLISILFLSSLLAYGITRFNSRFGNLIFLITLGGMALSEQVALVPLYKILQATHLYNTYWAVILPYVAFRIPFTVFLMRAYFMCIPKELEEAAVIDGATMGTTFRKIVVPMAKNTTMTVLTYNFVFVWNEFTYANTFISSSDMKTLPIGLNDFVGQFGRVDWGSTFAAIVISILPTLIVYFILNRNIIEGMAAGAVKS